MKKEISQKELKELYKLKDSITTDTTTEAVIEVISVVLAIVVGVLLLCFGGSRYY